MAFLNRVRGVLKQSVSASNLGGLKLGAANSSLFQAIRSMSSSKLFVGGLSYNMDQDTLASTFGQYGDVVEARIITDRETGRSKGFGFVTYTSTEAASSAIQALDGQELQGRKVGVNYATERPRAGGYSGYGGGGGYSGGGGYGDGGGYSGGGGNYGGGGGYQGGGYSDGGGNYNSGSGGFDNQYQSGGGGYGGGSNYSSGGGSTSGYGDVGSVPGGSFSSPPANETPGPYGGSPDFLSGAGIGNGRDDDDKANNHANGRG